MPNFDGTGPQGQGPLTGRGQGNCNPGRASTVGFSRGFGRSFGGRGRGFGMGRCRAFMAMPFSPRLQKLDLKDYRDQLKADRDYIDEELKAVEADLDQQK